MIREFINEKFERDPKSFISNKELHKMYIQFANENRLENISQRTLSGQLNKMRIGIQQRKMINRKITFVRYGLKVKK